MLTHLLVPLDGSVLSESALPYARQILGPGGRISLVSAVETPEIPLYGFDLVGVSAPPSYQNAVDDLLERGKKYLDGIAEGLRADGFDAHYMVQYGEPAGVIVDLAERMQVDAIVISTHGRSGISRWLFGSVTNKVLALAPCPVFVVPSADRKQLLAAHRALSERMPE